MALTKAAKIRAQHKADVALVYARLTETNEQRTRREFAKALSAKLDEEMFKILTRKPNDPLP